MADKPWPVAISYRANALSLEGILEAEFNTSQIRDLAKWLDVKLKGTSKSGYVQQIAEMMNARVAQMGENPDALLQGLSPEQIGFMRSMMTAQDAFAPLPRNTALRVWGKQHGADADRRLSEMIDSLRRRALLFPTQSYFAYSHRDVYYQWLPLPDVTPVLRWQSEAANTGAGPDDGALSAANFLRDFDAFLEAILGAGVRLRTPLPAHPQTQRTYWLTGWEHDADEAERVLKSRANWVPDPSTGFTVQMLPPFTAESANQLENQTGFSVAQCEFFWAIACALQLTHRPDATTQLAQANLPAVEEWLALADAAKLVRAWTAWTEQAMDGLEVRAAARGLERFKVVRAIGARALTPAHLAGEWCSLRRYLVRVLRGLPAESWVNWADLRHQLFEFFPECAWSITGRSEWWFAPPADKSRLNVTQEADWQLTVGNIFAHILRDSLQWFGVLDVQVDAEGQLRQFRLGEVGRWLIGTHAAPLPAAAAADRRHAAPITWQDAQTLLIPPSPERAELVSFVRKITERGPTAFSYRFSADSIEGALGQGIQFEEVARQLEAFKLKLSPALNKQFKQAAKRHGRVRVYERLTLLELDDDFALRELSANSSLAQHIVYQISPRAIVVRDDVVDDLIEELQEKGYTPGVS